MTAEQEAKIIILDNFKNYTDNLFQRFGSKKLISLASIAIITIIKAILDNDLFCSFFPRLATKEKIKTRNAIPNKKNAPIFKRLLTIPIKPPILF